MLGECCDKPFIPLKVCVKTLAPASTQAMASSKSESECPKATTKPIFTASRTNWRAFFLSGAIEILINMSSEALRHFFKSIIEGSVIYLGFSAPPCFGVKNGPSKCNPWIFAPVSSPLCAANFSQVSVNSLSLAVIVVGNQLVTPACNKPSEILLTPSQSLFIVSSSSKP